MGMGIVANSGGAHLPNWSTCWGQGVAFQTYVQVALEPALSPES